MGMRIIVVWSTKKYWRNATFRPTLIRSKRRDLLFPKMYSDSPLEALFLRARETVSFLTSIIDFITDQLIKGVIYWYVLLSEFLSALD